MSREIELKLALGPQGPDMLLRHPALAALNARRQWLANTYYDTPEGDLEAARVALRIRETPDGRLQTLKTAGKGSGGLHSRGEWEWPIDGEGLDMEGLRQHAPPALDEATLTRLTARFTTDFVRESWQYEEGDDRVEIALDQGKVLAAGREVAIREVELELKHGDPAALWRLAERLAERVALRPANASKAQRGAALREGRWALPALSADDAGAVWNETILALDWWQDSHDTHAWRRAVEGLQRLKSDAGLTPSTGKDLDTLGRALSAAEDAPDNAWLTPALAQAWLRLMRVFTP